MENPNTPTPSGMTPGAASAGSGQPPTVRPWNGIDENTRDPLELDDDAPAQPSELDDAASAAAPNPSPARRFLVQFTLTACEEYTAPTKGEALNDAENSDGPTLHAYTSEHGPEIVAEWDPVAEDWENTPAAPSPIRLIYGSLACVQTSDLILELQRRQSGRGDFAGDIEPCLVLAVTPSDLSDYWERDDAGSTHSGSATPTPEDWPALVKAFERWQDRGNVSDLMHALRDAWNTAKEDESK